MWSDSILGGMIARACPVVIFLGLVACGGSGGGSPPTTGTLAVSISDFDSGAGIAGARIIVIDGSSGDLLDVLTTNADGEASEIFPIGQVLLKVSAQDFQPSPASAEGSPLPYAIIGDLTTAAEIQLTPLADTETLGWITGKALDIDGTTGVANALVVASGLADDWYTTATDTDGSYVLFNVPEGGADVTALRGGHNFSQVPATVLAGQGTDNIDIPSVEAHGELSGMVQFLAIVTSNVDVTLLHSETGEVIPGLRAFTVNQRYEFDNLPDGTFDAIASLETDNLVLDPDHVAKFGVPQVTVSAGVASPDPLDFAVTGAVQLVTPENFEELPINALTFRWNAYPSTKNYILELINENGDVIWGGNAPGVNNYTVGTATQVTLAPEWTSEPLVEGKLYRVRVYAAVDTITDPFYKLISASEDLLGVFRVGPAE
jgi:hypothetical protein